MTCETIKITMKEQGEKRKRKIKKIIFNSKIEFAKELSIITSAKKQTKF